MSKHIPIRIQLSRAKGWRKPDGAIVVARPTRFGNPFPIEIFGRLVAIELHRRWVKGYMSIGEMEGLSHHGGISLAEQRRLVRASLPTLRGRDLCCWCALVMGGDYVPCHADVLLSLANEIPFDEVVSENFLRAKGQECR